VKFVMDEDFIHASGETSDVKIVCTPIELLAQVWESLTLPDSKPAAYGPLNVDRDAGDR
jgi:hypothetical protein